MEPLFRIIYPLQPLQTLLDDVDSVGQLFLTLLRWPCHFSARKVGHSEVDVELAQCCLTIEGFKDGGEQVQLVGT